MKYEGCKKSKLDSLRYQADKQFEKVRATWLDCGRWALPHAIKRLNGESPGQRNNQHIVDTTHILALRSYVAGFLEGNTSASRPWYRILGSDPDKSAAPVNKAWLQRLTDRTLKVLASSNFYTAAGGFYYKFGTFSTGALYIDELPQAQLYFHELDPGSYKILNNGRGEAVVLVREYQMSVLQLVETYGKNKNGMADWSNFSASVKRAYDNGSMTQMINVVHIIKENDLFDPDKMPGGVNRKWVSLTYEVGAAGSIASEGQEPSDSIDPMVDEASVYLKVSYSKRKPFIVGKGDSSANFEYGEKGPTIDALGAIKSLNKKAISKDQALEQMLRPALQGPASLRKSYITSAPNSYVPLDPTSMAQKGLQRVFDINPAIGSLVGDVEDLRQQVSKLYYADYLMYLSQNPKTRTAAETNAVVQEQQLIIGPNLQSLNWTFNIPVVDFITSFVIDEDPYLPPPPEDLAGDFLRTDFISVFAQAQRAADLPAIERYMAMITSVGQIDPRILQKANTDKLADLFEDRLYLPEGLNNPQAKVDAERQQNQAMAQRDKMLNETIPNLAGAQKDAAMAGQGQQ